MSHKCRVLYLFLGKSSKGIEIKYPKSKFKSDLYLPKQNSATVRCIAALVHKNSHNKHQKNNKMTNRQGNKK